MFGRVFALRLLVIVLVVLGLWALLAHDTSAGGPEQRYRVQPADTLWAVAVERYAGDPREAVWTLRERNGLDGTTIFPGQVLVLP
jgi:LysM repeat protein